MALLVVFSVLLFALTGHSSALYCLCKDKLDPQTLQTVLDYACGHGADCSPISKDGNCYKPNTVQDHCNYAANSYYQRNVNSGATCDFKGAATISATLPSSVASSCVYPSTSSPTPPTGTTPPTTYTPPTGTPPIGTTPPTTYTPPIGTTPPVFGIGGPSSTTTGNGKKNGAAVSRLDGTYTKFLLPLVLTTAFLAFRV